MPSLADEKVCIVQSPQVFDARADMNWLERGRSASFLYTALPVMAALLPVALPGHARLERLGRIGGARASRSPRGARIERPMGWIEAGVITTVVGAAAVAALAL